MEHLLPKDSDETLATRLLKLQRQHGGILALEDAGDCYRVTTEDGPRVEVRPATANVETRAGDAS